MKRLSDRQEQVMAIIWEYGPLTVRGLIPLMGENLHFNSISTVVRELERIGFLSHDREIRPFRYYPQIAKDAYIRALTDSISSRFFNNDKTRFAHMIML